MKRLIELLRKLRDSCVTDCTKAEEAYELAVKLAPGILIEKIVLEPKG